MFSTATQAKTHSNIHLGTTLLCPLAEEFNCDKLFYDIAYAKKHGQVHTKHFLCPRIGCIDRFASPREARQHAESPNHRQIKLFFCPVDTCVVAITREPLTAFKIKEHRSLHIKHGHIDESTEFTPEPATQPPLYSEFPLYREIIEHGALEDTGGDYEVDDIDTKSTSDENDIDDDDEDLPDYEFDRGILSKEHRLQILQVNNLLWSSNKDGGFRFTNLGLRCSGPTGGEATMCFE
ncbi:uncharacterized protein TRUGW13939_06148 [Talaromyces rugulosus]|uniref:C2H2-type domain-containing protein n=1 Tax=Talaromyces rugulosus TaxID=121627 RepID=A0A7H8QY41_TALRU|nr:uncharacterized protein TRUGW13939_06148 [Talaromyces rugulosus]QKX59019.1 hypothetical protein TRUGW13939_06148 [Talaromyces rugulosus]